MGGGVGVGGETAVGAGEGEGVGDGMAVGTGEGVGIGDGIAVGTGDGEGIDDGMVVGTGEGSRDGTAEGVGVGGGDSVGMRVAAALTGAVSVARSTGVAVAFTLEAGVAAAELLSPSPPQATKPAQRQMRIRESRRERGGFQRRSNRNPRTLHKILMRPLPYKREGLNLRPASSTEQSLRRNNDRMFVRLD